MHCPSSSLSLRKHCSNRLLSLPLISIKIFMNTESGVSVEHTHLSIEGTRTRVLGSPICVAYKCMHTQTHTYIRTPTPHPSTPHTHARTCTHTTRSILFTCLPRLLKLKFLTRYIHHFQHSNRIRTVFLQELLLLIYLFIGVFLFLSLFIFPVKYSMYVILHARMHTHTCM